MALKGKGANGSWDCKEWADKTNYNKLPLVGPTTEKDAQHILQSGLNLLITAFKTAGYSTGDYPGAFQTRREGISSPLSPLLKKLADVGAITANPLNYEAMHGQTQLPGQGVPAGGAMGNPPGIPQNVGGQGTVLPRTGGSPSSPLGQPIDLGRQQASQSLTPQQVANLDATNAQQEQYLQAQMEPNVPFQPQIGTLGGQTTTSPA